MAITRAAKSARAGPTHMGAEGDLPSYEKPPVSEVACGATFAAIKQFTTAHGGLFWSRIRDEFPEAEHAAPLATPAEGWFDSNLGLPLPRQWFISKDKQGLIQLQGDCLFFNWRRINDDDVYPRYGSVVRSYREILSAFLAYLSEMQFPTPAVTGCELTYVNHIPQTDGWKSANDLSSVFRDFIWNPALGRFLPTPKSAAWKAQFPMPSGGILTASLAQATRVRDQMPTLKFELSAKKTFQEKPFDDIWSWLDEAHEWIVRGFSDLTQDEIQRKVWKRTK